jgi:2-phospho-L-lactate guanylyltransferase
VTAIIPLNALDRAKGRLALDLDAASRRGLVVWMFERVVAACRASAAADLIVVAGDDEGAALAAQMGVRFLRQSEPGLRAALTEADIATADAVASIVVAADLPLARAREIDQVLTLGAGGAEPMVAVAATLDGGTGVLYRRPPGVIPTAYGPGSALAHFDLAVAAGVEARRVDLPGLALDIDTADSLRELAARLPHSEMPDSLAKAPWAAGLGT